VKVLSLWLLVQVGLAPATAALGAEPYGEATLCRGRLILVRDGRRLERQERRRVRILLGDLLRVGAEGTVLLTTRGATLRLAGNTILYIKAWQRQGLRGHVRMLYGRVTVVPAAGGRFTVTTAGGSIRSSGGAFTVSVTSRGDVVVFTHRETPGEEPARACPRGVGGGPTRS